MKKTVCMLVLCLLILVSQAQLRWQTLDTGLYLTRYQSPVSSFVGDNIITIVKVDPAYYRLNLFSVKDPGERSRTTVQWAKDKEQVLVINAGMYQTDLKTSCGYMKNYGHVNNRHVNTNNTILAFNPKEKGVPQVQIIDRQYQDWDHLKDKYDSYLQSIRMVSPRQYNCWGQSDMAWSMVVMAMDKLGNVLFIFTWSPYTAHDFVDILLQAPLDIYNMMFLEGGCYASMYVKCGTTELVLAGSDKPYILTAGHDWLYPLPNVIGVEKK